MSLHLTRMTLVAEDVPTLLVALHSATLRWCCLVTVMLRLAPELTWPPSSHQEYWVSCPALVATQRADHTWNKY